MPDGDLIAEAARQMTICNACRYCEGYCAVFPAMELRRAFTAGDLTYLANLCHDCRDCYYACQFAPPHAFAVNVPQIFAEIRADTYRDASWPAAARGLFHRNARAVAGITAVSALLILALVLFFQGPATLFGVHVGANAFYRVIPYAALVIVPSLVALWGIAVFARGARRFWIAARTVPTAPLGLGAILAAARDIAQLRYLHGGEAGGCNYPGAAFSQSRRWLHQLTFYGFLLDFAATTVAAFYSHILRWPAPYPLLSAPVVLGTVGGVMLLIGAGGLLVLKRRSDPEPAALRTRGMDVAFLGLLFLASLTGLALLALRETAAMGMLLVLHLGFVAGIFLTAPYGKFAHAVYRALALVRNALEQAAADRGAASL
ncbi:MAG TPA: tricarballylate utilization 4Fe-4S protein TcuB [Thermomicrobiales bacterium]|nr:tricarballylate utilization 4Fe-4S protein TcuB [Thermomicrobiales bacterium]